MGEEEKLEVSWNLSQSLIIELGNLLSVANKKWLGGDIDNAFYYLKAIYFRILQNLSADERKEFKNIEKERKEKIKQAVFSNYLKTHQNLNEINSFYYEKYNELLMDKLQENGYLIPIKEDSKRIF